MANGADKEAAEKAAAKAAGRAAEKAAAKAAGRAGEADAQMRNTATLTFGTLVSRVLGLLRDLLIAFLLGPAADALVLAFRVPNYIRRTGAEGGIGMAFSPFEAKVRTRLGEGAARDFAQRVFTRMLFLGALLALLLYAVTPWLLALLAPGAAADILERSGRLLHICLAFVPLSLAAYVACAHLTREGRFGLQAWSSSVLNLGILFAGGIAFVWQGGAGATQELLCLGLLAGALAQAVAGAYVLRPWKAAPCMFVLAGDCGAFGSKQDAVHVSVRLFFRHFPACVLGAAPHQIHFLAVAILASFLAPGGLSSLYFAERLLELPLAVAGAAIGTATLPHLTNFAACGRKKAFALTLVSGVRASAFLGLPAAAGLAALARPLTDALFLHGAFTVEAAAVSASALTAYAAGLPALCLSRPVLAAVNAAAPGKTTLYAALAGLAVLVPVGAGGVVLFQHNPVAGAFAVGAALSVASWCTLALLLLRLCRKDKASAKKLRKKAAPVLAVYGAAAVVLWAVLVLAVKLGLTRNIWETGGIIACAVFVWVAGFYRLGNKDAVRLVGLFQR